MPVFSMDHRHEPPLALTSGQTHQTSVNFLQESQACVIISCPTGDHSATQIIPFHHTQSQQAPLPSHCESAPSRRTHTETCTHALSHLVIGISFMKYVITLL